jgi:hypothetical protein
MVKVFPTGIENLTEDGPRRQALTKADRAST